jgi:hypothetical protein
MMDFVALAIGHALVWAAGVCVVALPQWWRDRRAGSEPPPRLPPDGGLAWTLGAGWLVGAFVLTLVMRAQSLAGMPFGRLGTGLPLLLIVVAGAGFALASGRWAMLARWRAATVAALRTAAGAHFAAPLRALWLALVGWMALRYALLAAEVMMRPLYPWDAWMQWATKARVWFELRSLVPFAPFDAWLPANGAAYFDAAPHYPATVPLWQVWSALLIGRWDDAHTNFAWWCTAAAICLLVYGFLRGAGGSRWLAIVGAWLAGSLPIANVHVALAGYADLPMAAYVTLGALAGWRWARLRRLEDLLLLGIALAALPTIKNPGKAWLVLLLPGVAVAAWPRWGLRAAGAIVGAGALVLLILAQTSPTILGYRIQYAGALPWQGLLDAYFLYASWHLLWFAVLAVAVLGARSLLCRDAAPFTVTLGLGLLFLLFGFAFTNASTWVDDQSTVNRATLHLAPLFVVWMLLVYRDWAGRLSGAAATATSPASEAAAPPAAA